LLLLLLLLLRQGLGYLMSKEVRTWCCGQRWALMLLCHARCALLCCQQAAACNGPAAGSNAMCATGMVSNIFKRAAQLARCWLTVQHCGGLALHARIACLCTLPYAATPCNQLPVYWSRAGLTTQMQMHGLHMALCFTQHETSLSANEF
jgi:hypothetical protein